MVRSWLLVLYLSLFVIVGCGGSPTYIDRPSYVGVDQSLLVPVQIPVPMQSEEYLKLDHMDREGYLLDYIKGLIKETHETNQRFGLLLEYDRRHRELYRLKE